MFALLSHRTAIADHAQRYVTAVARCHSVIPGKPVSPRKREQAIRREAEEVARFARRHSLGFIAKARLANKVKWGLRALGHSDQAVSAAVETLVISMSGL